MKLSDELQQLHDCGDVGQCVKGLAEQARVLEANQARTLTTELYHVQDSKFILDIDRAVDALSLEQLRSLAETKDARVLARDTLVLLLEQVITKLNSTEFK